MLDTYRELDSRVDGGELEALLARWDFGALMIRERDGGKQLPHGRLAELVETTGKSRSELKYRAQFAERWSRAEVANTLATYGSWHDVVKAFAREPSEQSETPALPPGKFSTIVADPPWDVKTPPTEFGDSGSAQALEYPTMSVGEIALLDVRDRAATNAHLYLWTINAYVEDAYHVARSWGFEPSTLLVWAKAPHGIGQGGTYVLTTEYVLFARRGSLRANERVDRSWFEWPRGAHSVKPAEFSEMVETVSPGPYLELFARREREDWTAWGNEVADELAA